MRVITRMSDMTDHQRTQERSIDEVRGMEVSLTHQVGRLENLVQNTSVAPPLHTQCLEHFQRIESQHAQCLERIQVVESQQAEGLEGVRQIKIRHAQCFERIQVIETSMCEAQQQTAQNANILRVLDQLVGALGQKLDAWTPPNGSSIRWGS